MKSLVVSALLAVVVHAVLLSFRMPWAGPTLTLPESRPVTISLVPAAKQPAAEKRVAPIDVSAPAPIQPLTPVALKKPAKAASQPKPPKVDVKKIAQPDTTVPEASAGDVQAVQTAKEPLDNDSVTAEKPTTADNQNLKDDGSAGGDNADVKASVPMYDLNPPIAYPAVAKRRGYQGRVMLNVFVSRQGDVQQVKMIQSSGYSVLDNAAVETVKGWRFEPARRSGRPTAMWVEVPIWFKLE